MRLSAHREERHGVIIETPTEARKPNGAVSPASPVVQLDICGAWNGCCLVRVLPYLARAVVTRAVAPQF
jgi:hypothetical protein